MRPERSFPHLLSSLYIRHTTAVSDATSKPAEWTHQLYRRNDLAPRPSHPAIASAMFSPLSDSTDAVMPASSSTEVIGAATGVTQPCIEGRLSKPARRRSRASRRAPTTLVNTNATNFRAMVQQFTGLPSVPYSASSAYLVGGGPPVPAMINYGIKFSDPQLGQTNLMQQQFQGHQQQYQPNGAGVGGGHDVFLQGFGDHGGSNMDVGDGFFFDGMPNDQMMPRAAVSTNNRIDGYFS